KIDQVVSFAGGADVAQAAAKKLGVTDVQALLNRRQVVTVSDEMMQFTAHGATRDDCSRVVKAFADATIAGYAREANEKAQDSVAALQEQVKDQQKKLDAIEAQSAAASGAARTQLQSQVDAAKNAVTQTLTDISNLQNAARTDAVVQWGSIDSSPASSNI